MPTLRGHHLICIHFFSGEGYDQTFIDNLRATLNSVKAEELEIGAGNDDICRKCTYLKNDFCHYSENADAEIREMDMKALELLDLAAGRSVAWETIINMIPGIFSEWYEAYCADCEWLTVCEKNDFFKQLQGC